MKNNILIMPIAPIHFICSMKNNNQKKSVYKVKQTYDNDKVVSTMSFKDMFVQKIKEQMEKDKT